jgi:hypothetical protein
MMSEQNGVIAILNSRTIAPKFGILNTEIKFLNILQDR